MVLVLATGEPYKPPRSLTENSARSEDGRKLRMKIRFCEENSELFDEQKRIFRPICCRRTTAWMQELEQRRSSCRVGQSILGEAPRSLTENGVTRSPEAL